MKIVLSISACLILAGSAFGQSNTLATLANSMQPGTFALLNTDGDSSGYSRGLVDCVTSAGAGVGSCYAYAQKAAYDPTSNRVYFKGAAHDGQPETAIYDIGTNHWSNTGLLSGSTYGHAYDSNAIVGGYLYASATLTANLFRRFNLSTQAWSLLSQPESLNFYGGEPSVEYFPDRSELLWLQGARPNFGGLGKYNISTDTWSVVSTNLTGLEIRSAIARYSASCQCVILIGGADDSVVPANFSHAVWKYDKNGVLTRLADSPSAIKIFISRATVATDPVTGNIIFIQAGMTDINNFTGVITMWSFNPVTGSWSQLPTQVPTGWWDDPNYPFAVVAAPIPQYGVILYASWGYSAGVSKVYLYKHSGTSDFAAKCAASGVVACYGFDSATSVRSFPVAAAYPLKYGGWNGAGPCASAGLGTEYGYTQGRNSSSELNALVKVQNGACVWPKIENGALRIDVPSKSDAGTGGYFDTPYKGLDLPFVGLAPEVWFQFKYKTQSMIQDFGGAVVNTFIKTFINGNRPPGLDYMGSDVTLAGIGIYGTGFGTNRNGLIESYTYDAIGNLQPTERLPYLQTASLCQYNGAGPYSYPPCVRFVDGVWQTYTAHYKLQAVASDFTTVASGKVIYRQTPWTTADMVGRYIAGAAGSFRVSFVINQYALQLDTAPPDATNQTYYMSNYPNSVIEEWLDGVKFTSVADQRFAWDLATGGGFGQIRLQPHMTNKDPNIAHTPGVAWYDELIISSQPISMVGGQQQSPAPPPTEPPPCKGNGKKCN